MKITSANVTIMVANMDASIKFYEIIGFTLTERWGEHFAIITAPGIAIGIHPGGPVQPSEQVSIGFMVDNMEEAKEILDANNIDYEPAADENKSGIFARFNDPDGTPLYFTRPMW